MLLKKLIDLNNSLLFRLTVQYAVAFTILSTIGFWIFYYRIYTITMENLDLELTAEIQRYEVQMQKSGNKGIWAAILNEVKFKDPDEGFYQIFNINGQTLMSTDMSCWGGIASRDILAKMNSDQRTLDIQTLACAEYNIKARTITAILGPDTVLQIGESLEDVDDYMNVFLKLFSILVICLIILSTIIGWILARQATIGMREVTKTAKEISNGAYDQRVKIKGRFNEIKQLGATFNHMLDRIHDLLKSMKDINDNIAHDLRSPLARIRGIAEMNLLKEKTIDDYKEMAANTIEECDMLIDMINTMLDITEAEAGVNGVSNEEFELSQLIKEACELFRPIAEGKKITLKTNLPESLILVTDRKKMQRIAANLLENAIKYTPENKMISISVSAQKNQVLICFEDTGIGISKSDIPHVFERFYRCDQSRSQGGVGLGLSLVKAYTESINGSIHVESTVNQGSRFTLKFVC